MGDSGWIWWGLAMLFIGWIIYVGVARERRKRAAYEKRQGEKAARTARVPSIEASDLQAFVAASLTDPVRVTVPIRSLATLTDALAASGKQGAELGEFVTRFQAAVSASCPKCGQRFRGPDLARIVVLMQVQAGRPFSGTNATIERMRAGLCSWPGCGSTVITLEVDLAS